MNSACSLQVGLDQRGQGVFLIAQVVGQYQAARGGPWRGLCKARPGCIGQLVLLRVILLYVGRVGGVGGRGVGVDAFCGPQV